MPLPSIDFVTSFKRQVAAIQGKNLKKDEFEKYSKED